MKLENLYPEVQLLQTKLLDHSLYAEVNSLQRLKWFMEDHVFAVWDFMSLTKRLQNELTSVGLPWIPPRDAALSRFINEIVWAEESDIDASGRPMSHLQMYLAAMEEVGADTGKFTCFLEHLNEGQSVDMALKKCGAPFYVQSFVNRTLSRAVDGQAVEVAADFLFGREDAIPAMFQRFLTNWDRQSADITTFLYYLQRHIDLDGDEHGPAARVMLSKMAGGQSKKWDLAARAAAEAIQSRIDLWDGVLAKYHYLESVQFAGREEKASLVSGFDKLLEAS